MPVSTSVFTSKHISDYRLLLVLSTDLCITVPEVSEMSSKRGSEMSNLMFPIFTPH